MPRLVQCVLALLLVAGVARPATAQNGLPDVVVVQSGVGEFLKDMQFIVELAGENGKQQWADSLLPTLQFFTPGVALEKPLRVDVLLEKETRVRLNVPVANLPGFLQNLVPFGINNKQLAADFFALDLPGADAAPQPNKNGPPTKAFLRHVFGYAAMSYEKLDVPAALPDPAAAINELLKKQYDVVGQATNELSGIDKRRAAFDTFRRNLLDALQIGSGEADDDFEIRKLLLTQQLEVAERFFVESARLVAGWTTDVPQREGRFDIELTALTGTSLEKAIQRLGNAPSHFAHVRRRDDAILSGRINFTLDKLYQDQLLALTKLLRPSAHRKIDALERSDEQKLTAKSLSDMFLNLYDAGTLESEVDGFVEVVPAKNDRYAMVGAIRVPRGDVPLNMLKLLPLSDPNLKLELDVDLAGSLAIHKLTGLFKNNADLQDLFGENAALFCSFEDQAVWYAVAVDSPAILKSAMQKNVKAENVARPNLQDAAAGAAGAAQTAGVTVAADIKPIVATIDVTQAANGETHDDAKEAAEPAKPAVDADRPAESTKHAPLFDLRVKVGPWVAFLDRRRKRLDQQQTTKKLTLKEQSAKKEDDKLRQMALAAFGAGADSIHVTMKRFGDQVNVHVVFGEGILRFVGSVIADVAEEIL